MKTMLVTMKKKKSGIPSEVIPIRERLSLFVKTFDRGGRVLNDDNTITVKFACTHGYYKRVREKKPLMKTQQTPSCLRLKLFLLRVYSKSPTGIFFLPVGLLLLAYGGVSQQTPHTIKRK